MKCTVYIRNVLITFFLLYPVIGYAGSNWESGAVTGNVTSSQGSVANLTVIISSESVPSPMFGKSVATDSNGSFYFDGVPVGNAVIKVYLESGVVIGQADVVIMYAGETVSADMLLE